MRRRQARARAYWTHEINGRVWGSTLVADGKVYVPTSKGLLVFADGKEKKLLRTIKIGSGCYCTPCAANGMLFVASQKYLYALCEKGLARHVAATTKK